MGLDTYAARGQEVELTPEDVAAFDLAKPQLCGGIESGGYDSFRGKIYADVVEHVAGVSLYQEWIAPETVRAMADAFDRCDPEQVSRESEQFTYQTTEYEVVELRRFFRICADRGLGLAGWW